MAAFNTFNNFSTDLLLGNHIIGTHTFKVLLTNSLPVATNAVKTDITEISSGNGYSSGGATTTVTKSLSGTTTTVFASNVTFTATGAIGPFEYEVLYNSTTSKLIGWTSAGSPITMASTDVHNVDYDQTNGVLQVG